MNLVPMQVRLQEDPETGELYLPIPESWLDALGWHLGDVMSWEVRANGDCVFTNRSKQGRDRVAPQASVGGTNPAPRDGAAGDTAD